MLMLRAETGSALFGALIILLMLGVIGVAAVQTSESDMTIADNYKSGLRSFYTAEAGAELAFVVLRDTITWRTGFTDHEFSGGTFSVEILDATDDSTLIDTILIRSTGRRSDAVSVIEVKVTPNGSPFRWAAFADDDFKLCGGTSTDSYDSDSGSYATTQLNDEGDVGSNGFIDLCGNADIEGDVSTSSPGDIDVSGGAQFHDSTSAAAHTDLSPITQSQLDDALASSIAPAGLSGQYNYNGGSRDLRINPGKTMTMAGGTYYFNEWDIKGTINLEPGASVEIYIVGDVKMNSQAAINASGLPKDFLIFGVGDNFDVTGGATVHAAVYAPETDFKFTGNGDYYGSFITKTAKDAGGSSFHYDRSLRNLEIGGGFERVSWQEL